MEIKTIADFRRAMRHGPYAWPGGYPCYFVMSDGEAMSFASARECRRCLLESLADHAEAPHVRSDWLPVAVEINWKTRTCAVSTQASGSRAPMAMTEPFGLDSTLSRAKRFASQGNWHMTRKHFIALAKAIADISNMVDRQNAAHAVADICRSANPAFDRARFLAACGL